MRIFVKAIKLGYVAPRNGEVFLLVFSITLNENLCNERSFRVKENILIFFFQDHIFLFFEKFLQNILRCKRDESYRNSICKT